MPNQEAKTCAKVLVEEFWCRYGIPTELDSDQSQNFDFLLFSELCKLLEIRKTRTLHLHSQSDGLDKRYNRTLKEALKEKVYDDPCTWDVHLPYVMAGTDRRDIHQ